MFRLIDAEKTNYTITRMISLLNVSRSGYYKWSATRAAGPSPAAVRRAALDAKVAAFHKASDDVYGSPRILADLREDGETVSKKTVAASMRRQRLQGISPRKFTPVTTIPQEGRANPEDLVNRVWDTGMLDRVWTSDITYLPTGQGWVYLCAVRDGCSRRVIGWAMADHMRTELVTAALNMAVAFRGQRPPKVVFHADRGTQYTSTEMAEYAAAHGLACSVGRTGVCWDNAQQESYWASLKVEFYDRRCWPTRAEAMTAVGDWIERVYNRRRRHSALDMLSPVRFEQLHRQTAEAA
jgi:transposase InsO family protein